MAPPVAAVAEIADATPPGSLTGRTVTSLQWTFLGTICSSVLQVGVTAVMSRLMTPAAYGLIAAAGIFLRFGSYFSEMGIGQALVQKPDLSRDDIRAAFTGSSLIGIAAASLMALLAPLATHLVNNPDVVVVVRLLAVGLALNGIASTGINLLRRHLRFRVLSGIEVASYAVSYGLVGIPLALMNAGVWALTAALLTQPLTTLFLAYAATRHSLVPSGRWKNHSALLSYGAKMSITSFAEYVFYIAEPSVIARRWGAAVLGMYNRCGLLATMPTSNLSSAIMKVVFPAFARSQGDRKRLASAYLAGLTAIHLVSVPVALGMIPAAQDLVSIMLGRQYSDGAVILQLLVLSMPLGMSASLAATACNVTDVVGRRLRQQVALCCVIWLAVWIGSHWGIKIVIIVSVTVQCLRTWCFHNLARRALHISLRELLTTITPSIQFGLSVWIAITITNIGLGAQPAIIRLCVDILIGSCVVCILTITSMPSRIAPFVLLTLDSNESVSRIGVVKRFRRTVEAHCRVIEVDE